jgi:hypothetical protein
VLQRPIESALGAAIGVGHGSLWGLTLHPQPSVLPAQLSQFGPLIGRQALAFPPGLTWSCFTRFPSDESWIRATWTSVTVLSLSVKQYVGAPPITRKHRSNPAITDGNALSISGTITRNRDHANHAQNNGVIRPATIGPSL